MPESSRCNCGGYFSGNHKDNCAGLALADEASLITEWETANKAWQADVFNLEKEKAVNDAAFALNMWRRVHTPEGRAYADSPKTYADETGDNAPEDDDA